MLGLGSLDLMRRRGMSRAPFMAGALGMRRGMAGRPRPQVGMPSTPAAQGIPQGLSQLSTRAVDPTGKSQGVYQGGAIQAPGMWAGSSQQGLPQGKTSYLDQGQPPQQAGDPINMAGDARLRQPAQAPEEMVSVDRRFGVGGSMMMPKSMADRYKSSSFLGGGGAA